MQLIKAQSLVWTRWVKLTDKVAKTLLWAGMEQREGDQTAVCRIDSCRKIRNPTLPNRDRGELLLAAQYADLRTTWGACRAMRGKSAEMWPFEL